MVDGESGLGPNDGMKTTLMRVSAMQSLPADAGVSFISLVKEVGPS